MFLRKKFYDFGLLKQYISEVPTICIGNISWGGTGKSPVTDYLVTAFQERKKKSIILTRGYKSELPHYPFLLNNMILDYITQEQNRQHKIENQSKVDIDSFHIDDFDIDDFEDVTFPDESLMLLKRHPQLEIIISPDRVLGAKRVCAFADLAVSKQSHLTSDHSQIHLEVNPAHIYADFMLMDDGFQHLKLCPDYHFLLLDKDDFYPHDFLSGIFSATYSWNTQIPLGTWREPKQALKRADIFLAKCPHKEWPLIREYAIEKLAPFHKPLFLFEIIINSVEPIFEQDKERQKFSIQSFQENKMPYAFVCAVANPTQAEQSITNAFGYAPSKSIFLPDHFDFKEKMGFIQNILKDMPVICTEKDAVKLLQKPDLANTNFPLLTTKTHLKFYDSVFYDREKEILNSIDRSNKSQQQNENNLTTKTKQKQEQELLINHTMYKQHENALSQSIADVLKPVDPYTLSDHFDPDYYKYQLHHNPIYPCKNKPNNRFLRNMPDENINSLSDFDHWLECNIFTIAPMKKLINDYIS